MTRPLPRDPFVGTTKLLVDGTNLLHALTRGPERQPPAAVIGRMRAAVPAETAITIVFDGPAESGIRNERIAGGLSVRYSGRRTADEVIEQLVADAAIWSDSDDARGTTLVVTDDGGLRAAVHRRGARTAGTRWLIGRLERPSLASPSVGNRRPPKAASVGREEPGEEVRWSPGRGATAKKGNPRRSRKAPRRG
ncbi:MAG: NYN domain-containing protein [Chloroflexota bacterium]